MPKIEFNRNHNLPREELLKRADVLVQKLQEKMAMLNMEYTWRPDKSGIDYEGNGFSGHIDLKDNSIYMLVDLSLKLAVFKGMVETQIGKSVEKLVAPVEG